VASRKRRTGQLATHTARRIVATTLFVDGGEALEDIARFVGHAKPPTTAGYVKRLGRRPEAVVKRAAAVLDAQADANDSPEQGSESPADPGSNRGSYGPGSSDEDTNDGEPQAPGRRYGPGRLGTVTTRCAERVVCG